MRDKHSNIIIFNNIINSRNKIIAYTNNNRIAK